MIDPSKVDPDTVLLHPQFEGGSHSEPPYPEAGKLVRVVFQKPHTRVHPRTGFQEHLASVRFERTGVRMVRPEELFLLEDEASAWARLAVMADLYVDELEGQLADWRAYVTAWKAGGPYVEAE